MIRFVFEVIGGYKTSNLEGNLRFLHFSHAEQLLVFIRYCLVNQVQVELAVRVLVFLVNQFQQSLAGSHKFVRLLDDLRRLASRRLTAQIDSIGLSLAGMKLLRRELSFVKEETVEADTFK